MISNELINDRGVVCNAIPIFRFYINFVLKMFTQYVGCGKDSNYKYYHRLEKCPHSHTVRNIPKLI